MNTGGRAGRSFAAVRRAATVLAAAALASGCGGGDGSSATENWAEDVCTAFSDWREAAVATGESLRSGPTTADDLRTAVDELDEATQDFADDLRDLGPPETDAGQEAKVALDELADDVEENASDVRSAVEGASGVQGVLEAAAAVAPILSMMGQQLDATFEELEQLGAAGELSDAFEQADACEPSSEGG